MPSTVRAYGVAACGEPVAPLDIKRRDILSDDVRIDIKWTGICGSDLHQARDDWNVASYPLVPGHEIVGVVSETGSEVKNFKVGDYVAIGAVIDSCRECEECLNGQEQFCLEGRVATYNSIDKHLPGQRTYGGYSEQILVNENYVIKIPDSLSKDPEKLKGVAPIACAGITTWAPLLRFGAGPGRNVGIVGLGGLGHMAVKLAYHLGADVTVISRSHEKDEIAKKIGASKIVCSKNEEEMKAARRSLDFIIDTVPFDHDVNVYLPLIRTYGALVVVGHVGPLKTAPFSTGSIVFGNKILAGSFIAGIEDTQELFDFCGEKNIIAEVEPIEMSDINKAWAHLQAGDSHHRFVIDVEAFRAQKEHEK